MQCNVQFDRDQCQIIIRSSTGEDLIIRRDDVATSFFSGGPGGQNVNRHLNGVRLTYVIPESHRLKNKKTTSIVSKSMRERKREQNLIFAFSQLADKIAKYYYTKPLRKPTKVPKKAKEKRLWDKKRQSQKKQSRMKNDY